MKTSARRQPNRKRSANKIKVLFFCRGRGRGHAIPDIAIAEEFPALTPHIELTFASYATGAQTFRQSGWPVIDLGLPEANPFLSTLLVASELIERLRPDVVVTHEEFAVLPAAKLAAVPSLLLIDWYPASNHIAGEALAYASSIVFLGEPGVFPLPVPVQHPPVYVGSVVRKMKYTLRDRAKARAELGISEDAFVLSVIPGSWATEERAPIAAVVLEAFRRLTVPDKHLFWLSKTDHASLQKLAADIPQARILSDCATPEQLMVASDLVLTKGNRGTIIDAASLGVPSLSLSWSTNPVDEALITRIASNKAFNAKAVDASMLSNHLNALARVPFSSRELPKAGYPQGGKNAAQAILGEIGRIYRS